MKTDIPAHAGIGFTILVATATFLVAVIAGLFLLWQSDEGQFTQRQATNISLATPADVRRGADTHPPSLVAGINPTPQPLQ